MKEAEWDAIKLLIDKACLRRCIAYRDRDGDKVNEWDKRIAMLQEWKLDSLQSASETAVYKAAQN